MTHRITLTDEQYDRLQATAEVLHATPDQVVADLLAGLPQQKARLPREEYDQRWAAFFQLVGSITRGMPITNEEIDEVIGEEAAESDTNTDTNLDGIG